MFLSRVVRRSLIVIVSGAVLAAAADSGNRPAPPETVFDMPRLHGVHMRLATAMRHALQRRDYEAMERICREGVALLPENPTWHYNLACALARLSRTKPALLSLEKAVRLGFRNAEAIRNDPDLAGLRDAPELAEILAEAAAPAGELAGTFARKPTAVVGGRALVSETNTTWNFDLGCFQTGFTLPDEPAADIVARDLGEAGELVNRWYAEGRAAGNHGDFYDNRDRGHSDPGIEERFPQVSLIRYAPIVKERDLDWRMSRFLFNGVVVGNCSMAQTHPVFWRSLPRMALSDSGMTALLFIQYLGNQLYVYPSHKDFLPAPPGRGDVYFARTPYMLISRGSSYTDKPFLEAVFLALAAFPPEVKQHLASSKQLMPTVQMLLRASVVEPDGEYLAPEVHPVCMPEDYPDPVRLVRMAQSMTAAEAPPVINLRMLEEQPMRFGKDFFDIRRGEGLFDTPCAIARVVRGMPYRRRYVVSAENTHASDGTPLRFQWAILQGDPEKVQINPLNEERSRVEILLDYHEPFPVPGDPEIESSRVDVAVSAFNGKYPSAPGFISFYYLPNEKRLYSSDKRILSVDYAAARDVYVDPTLSLPRHWRDDYLYTPDKHIKGWLRIQAGKVDTYTADGWVAKHKDARGRALVARNVQYVPRQNGEDQIPELIPVPGNKRAAYEYESGKDFIGRIVKEEELR